MIAPSLPLQSMQFFVNQSESSQLKKLGHTDSLPMSAPLSGLTGPLGSLKGVMSPAAGEYLMSYTNLITVLLWPPDLSAPDTFSLFTFTQTWPTSKWHKAPGYVAF